MRRLFSFLVLFTCTGWLAYAQEVSLQTLINQKKYGEVLEYAENLSAADSTNLSVMYTIGQAYEGMLKYREAYKIYHYCYEMDTTDIDVLNTLARAAINLGRPKEAESYFGKVLVTDSTNFYANYQLARMYFQIGDYDKAIIKYMELHDQDYENSAILRNIGDCYSRKESWIHATLFYSRAYENNRENAGLALNLINSMLRSGDEAFTFQSLAFCDTALYYNPNNVQLRRSKGLALHANKKYAEADTVFTRLMEEGDSTYMTLKYGGSCRYYAGQFFNAIAPLEAAFEKDTSSVEVCLLLGSSLGKTYDRKRAFEMFEVAEENLQPKPFLVYQLLVLRGETYQKDGNYPEAAHLYYLAWENSNRLDLLQRISQMYYATDQAQYKSEENRQRGLFIHTLFTKELLKKGENLKHITQNRKLFESFYEDMFFRGVNEMTMIAPDGKKFKITSDELQSLIKKIPEKNDNVG